MTRSSAIVLASAAALTVSLVAACSHPSTPVGPAPSQTAASPYVGSRACAACHPDEFRKQSASPHALTLRAAGADWGRAAVPAGTRVTDAHAGVDYLLEERDGQYQVAVQKDGREVGTARFDYLLGSGHHGATPMSFDGQRWSYLPVSYYANKGWDLSPSQPISPKKAIAATVGTPVTIDELQKCFACHATNVTLAGSGLDLRQTEVGIRCESCHGPGRAHVEAVQSKAADPAITNPRRWSTPSFMALCQQCHNETSTLEGSLYGISADPKDPSTVKYQVYGLEQSRCYKQSGGKLRCTTCHDPHTAAETRPVFYEARCLSCHSPRTAGQKACPVNARTACLSCHMPEVKVADHTEFADHWIRARSPFAAKSGRITANPPGLP